MNAVLGEKLPDSMKPQDVTNVCDHRWPNPEESSWLWHCSLKPGHTGPMHVAAIGHYGTVVGIEYILSLENT